MKTVQTILLFLLLIFLGCSKSDPSPESKPQNITLLFVNDSHGQIDNFSKVKYIIDQEKQTKDVLVISTGYSKVRLPGKKFTRFRLLTMAQLFTK